MKPIVLAPTPGPVAPDGEVHPAGALLAAAAGDELPEVLHAAAVRLNATPAAAIVISRLSLRAAGRFDKKFTCPISISYS